LSWKSRGARKMVFLRILVLATLLGLAADAQNVRISNTYVFDGKVFQWKVFVDEPPATLERINCVEYTLHPAFRDRVRTQCDASNNFSLSAAGATEFTIVIEVRWKDGRTVSQSYSLDLHTAEERIAKVSPLRLVHPLLKGIRPVALNAGVAQVVLADLSGRLLGITLSDKGIAVTQTHALGSADLIAAVLATLGGREMTVVSHDPAGRPMLDAYPRVSSGYGPWLKLSPGDLQWLALDSAHGIVYALTSSRWPSLFSVDLLGSKSHIKEILGLPGSDSSPRSVAGPIVWLPTNHLLMCSETGDSFRDVDLGSNPVKTKALSIEMGSPLSRLRSPRALAFDGASARILVADGSRIRSITLRYGFVAIREFGPNKLFGAITAITIDHKGKVWVGDEDRQSIFVLSADGVVEETLSGR